MASGLPCTITATRETPMRSGAGDGIRDRSFDIRFTLLRGRVPGRGEIDDVLPVPRWARDTRIAYPEDGRAQPRDEAAELLQHAPAHLRVAHDAAAGLALAHLELRLHEHEHPP